MLVVVSVAFVQVSMTLTQPMAGVLVTPVTVMVWSCIAHDGTFPYLLGASLAQGSPPQLNPGFKRKLQTLISDPKTSGRPGHVVWSQGLVLLSEGLFPITATLPVSVR